MKPAVTTANAVTIRTYSRLHLGFFDLSAHPMRQFGSMGFAVDAFTTSLSAHLGSQNPALPEWVARQLQCQQASMGLSEPVHVSIHNEIPRHSGLGSGTQMALAIGAAVALLAGQTPQLATIASVAGRGHRSGIGIGTFGEGGFVVDGGRSTRTNIPPIMMQTPMPNAWCALLILVDAAIGLHGQAEKSAFATLKPQSDTATQLLASDILMRGLPALCEADFEAFATCVGQLQAYNADYFAPAQGGLYANAAVAQVLDQLSQAGYRGIGQTSWGPTGFVLLPNVAEAELLQQRLAHDYADSPLQFKVCHPVNHGAVIHSQ